MVVGQGEGVRVQATGGDTFDLRIFIGSVPGGPEAGYLTGDSYVTDVSPDQGTIFVKTFGGDSLQITIEVMSSIERGLSSPIRYVPPGILAAKSSSESAFAWMVAIKPKYGDWEGYTSWDARLDAPRYEDELGNVTPALRYQPNGAEISRIPQALKLGAQSTDVKVLSPKLADIQRMGGIPQVYLPRDKMESGYYVDGFWELFEVMPESNMVERLSWVCGEIGQVSFDDIQATIELATYEDIVNRTIGDQLHIYCQVGARRDPTDRFGDGRCRNMVLEDGPLRADWTALTTVLAGSEVDAVRLSFESDAISGLPLPAQFTFRMNNGNLEFLGPDDGGGILANREFPLRGANVISVVGGVTTLEIYPKLALPFVPEVGDKAHLVVGCTKTKTVCRDVFNNLDNFRGQDLPGNDDLQRRTRT